jgi:dihydrofolate synthase/folylpolyglutamate synthase
MPETEPAYNKALDYLYSFVDYSLKHSSELAKADFNLDRMFALMTALGEPQTKYAIIHVAGTKGKGSICALTASALHAGGYKTGLYSSPHLLDFCERIQVNGEPVTHEDFVELVEQIKPAVAKIEKLTTFEIATALAFLHFARQHVDVAVIEVGLGGRLDATNVVMPSVSVISALSYDHMAVLGDTLTKIAGEKAGIIKQNVPVVSAPQPDEALEVLVRVATERHAPFTLVGKDVQFTPLEHSLDGQSLEVSAFSIQHSALRLQLPLLGIHQVENAATAYAALKASGLEISDRAIQKGFAAVKWPGRFEVMGRKPFFVIDSAHNRESANRLRKALDDYFPEQPAILVFATLEDKDATGMLEELSARLTKIIATQADHPRALEVEKIVALSEKLGIPAEAVKPSSSALERAQEIAGKDAIIISAGSVAFAGEMRTAWKNNLEKKS